jgi:hypothetical protein
MISTLDPNAPHEFGPHYVHPMGADEARACLDRVKGHWQNFWFELKDFHDRRGWKGLGYDTFKECIERELGVSEVHFYRLLKAAELRLALADALEDSTNPGVSLDAMTERHARELAPLPRDAQLEIARRVDFRTTSAAELSGIVARTRRAFRDYAGGVEPALDWEQIVSPSAPTASPEREMRGAVEQLNEADPDGDAVVQQVESEPSLLNARLAHDYSKLACRFTDGLAELDPTAVAEVLDARDREGALEFADQLIEWGQQFRAALTRPIRVVQP